MSLFTSTIAKTGRYGFLLMSMCLMIGLKPFLNTSAEDVLVSDIFFTGILISGIYALDRDPIAFRISCGLMAAVIVLKVLHHAIGITHYHLHLLEIIFIILFIMQVLMMTLKHIVIEQEVTSDIVMGGACAFVLLGFFWAYVYYLLEIILPNSIKGSSSLSSDPSDYIYFSFVTLTSTGYGDILAISPKARGLSILEAIIGQLYLAIMISRLVSLHISDSRHS